VAVLPIAASTFRDTDCYPFFSTSTLPEKTELYVAAPLVTFRTFAPTLFSESPTLNPVKTRFVGEAVSIRSKDTKR
jgi:hypothetical protein